MTAEELLAPVKERFCAGNVTPLDFTALLLTLLQDYFSQSTNILHESISGRIFTGTDATNILIESAGRFTPTKAERRPAILISQGPWKVRPHTIGAGTDFSKDANENYNYYRIIDGSHIITCIAKSVGETEILGSEVFKFLLMAEPIIVSQLPINTFFVAEMSQAQPVKESRDHFLLKIAVSYSFSIKFTIERLTI